MLLFSNSEVVKDREKKKASIKTTQVLDVSDQEMKEKFHEISAQVEWLPSNRLESAASLTQATNQNI